MKILREAVREFIEKKAGCHVDDVDTFKGLRITELEKENIVKACIKEFGPLSSDNITGTKTTDYKGIKTVGQLIDLIVEDFGE